MFGHPSLAPFLYVKTLKLREIPVGLCKDPETQEKGNSVPASCHLRERKTQLLLTRRYLALPVPHPLPLVDSLWEAGVMAIRGYRP